MTTRRFANNFHRKTQPPSGEPCTLKDHYSGVMRELIGYLDSLAAQDPTGERFVYAKPETIFKHCKKFAGMGYGKRVLWYALAEARERRIISNQVMRERWVGSGKKGQKVLRKLNGCIVAQHDCMARMVDGECVFHGPMQLCGSWARTGDAGPGSALYWNGCAQHVPATGGLPNGSVVVAVPNAAPVQPQVQPVCSDRAVAVQPVCSACAVADSGQNSDLPEVNPKNGGQAVVTVIPGVSRESREEPVKPVEPAPPVQAAAQIKTNTGASPSSSQPSGACAPYGHDVTKPAGSEITIGQQFGIFDDIQLLQEISDGEFNPYPYKETGDIDLLAEYTRMVVKKMAAQPWDNQRATCARLMDSVAKQIKRDGQEYPAGWLAVIYELRKGGPCSETVRRQFQQPGGWSDLAGIRANLKRYGTKYPNNTAWEMCGDGIKRIASERERLGFTVLAADGIWDKP